jgi:hypothetical protein
MYEARNPLLLDYQTKYLHIAVTGHGMHLEIHNFFYAPTWYMALKVLPIHTLQICLI